MEKMVILYATLTGHSKKIAEAIGKALKVKVTKVSARPVFTDVDLLFIVGGIYGGKSLPGLLAFVRTLDAAGVKRAVLVTSSAREQNQDSVRKILKEKGIEVLDEFNCPGSFLFLRFGHPDEADLQQAVDFAVKIAGEASKGAGQKRWNM